MDGQRGQCPMECDRNACAWWIAVDTGVRRDIEGEPTAEEHVYLYDCAVPVAAHSMLEAVKLLAEIAGRLEEVLARLRAE